jgi:Ser/Thr protein kinase RdoA (MazF antagonist)
LGSAAKFLRHTFDSGVPVCEILFSRDAHLVKSLEIDSELRLVQVLRGVPGVELTTELLENRDVLRAWGESLGQLHASTKTLNLDDLEFSQIQVFWANVKSRIPEGANWLGNEYDTITTWFETQNFTENFGLTHGDFRPGNAFWDTKKVWLIDFDEPVWHWFASDIARAMLEFTGNLKDRHAKLEVFMKGYRKHHDLDFSSADFAMLSRFRVMLMWLWALEGSGIGDDIYHLKARILEPFKW